MSKLSEAREDFLLWERRVVQFPDNRVARWAREQAYKRWLVAVRCWRLGRMAVDDAETRCSESE